MQSSCFIYVRARDSYDSPEIKISIAPTLTDLIAKIRRKLKNNKFKSLYTQSGKLISAISDIMPGDTLILSNTDPNNVKNKIRHSNISSPNKDSCAKKSKTSTTAKYTTNDSATLLAKFNSSLLKSGSTVFDQTQISNTENANKTQQKTPKPFKKTQKKDSSISKQKKQNPIERKSSLAIKQDKQIRISKIEPCKEDNNNFDKIIDQDIDIKDFSTDEEFDISINVSPIKQEDEKQENSIINNRNNEVESDSTSGSSRSSLHSHLDLTSNKLDVLLKLCPHVLEVLSDDDVAITYDI